MATTTVRIPKDKRDTLKIIANVEKRDIKEILSELIDEYIERHKETLEIFFRPDWVASMKKRLKTAEKGNTIQWRKKKARK